MIGTPKEALPSHEGSSRCPEHYRIIRSEVRLLALLPPLISLESEEHNGIGWLLEQVMKSITSGSSDLLGSPASPLAALLRIRGETRLESGIIVIYAIIMYKVGKLRQYLGFQ